MAVNHADGMTLGTFLVCPIVAGTASVTVHAGWYIVLFVPLGLVIGTATAWLVHKTGYLILSLGCKLEKAWQIWPLFLVYMVLPMAVGALGCMGAWFGTLWLAQRMG